MILQLQVFTAETRAPLETHCTELAFSTHMSTQEQSCIPYPKSNAGSFLPACCFEPGNTPYYPFHSTKFILRGQGKDREGGVSRVKLAHEKKHEGKSQLPTIPPLSKSLYCVLHNTRKQVKESIFPWLSCLRPFDSSMRILQDVYLAIISGRALSMPPTVWDNKKNWMGRRTSLWYVSSEEAVCQHHCPRYEPTAGCYLLYLFHINCGSDEVVACSVIQTPSG